MCVCVCMCVCPTCHMSSMQSSVGKPMSWIANTPAIHATIKTAEAALSSQERIDCTHTHTHAHTHTHTHAHTRDMFLAVLRTQAEGATVPTSRAAHVFGLMLHPADNEARQDPTPRGQPDITGYEIAHTVALRTPSGRGSMHTGRSEQAKVRHT